MPAGRGAARNPRLVTGRQMVFAEEHVRPRISRRQRRYFRQPAFNPAEATPLEFQPVSPGKDTGLLETWHAPRLVKGIVGYG